MNMSVSAVINEMEQLLGIFFISCICKSIFKFICLHLAPYMYLVYASSKGCGEYVQLRKTHLSLLCSTMRQVLAEL